MAPMATPDSTAGAIVGAIVGVFFALFLVISFWKSVLVVREKQQVVLERCGRFRAVLTPGVHVIMPWIDRPKTYSVRYYLDSPTGNVMLVEVGAQSHAACRRKTPQLAVAASALHPVLAVHRLVHRDVSLRAPLWWWSWSWSCRS